MKKFLIPIVTAASIMAALVALPGSAAAGWGRWHSGWGWDWYGGWGAIGAPYLRYYGGYYPYAYGYYPYAYGYALAYPYRYAYPYRFVYPYPYYYDYAY